MYIVPIVTQPLGKLTQYWLFLERNGTHLIEVNGPEEAIEFLVDNGLVEEPQLLTSPALSGVAFAPVESTAALEVFYSWREIAPGSIPAKEAWRNFLWDKQVAQGLRETSLSPIYTAYDILGAAESILSQANK